MIELVEVKHYDATPEICPQCLEPMDACACDTVETSRTMSPWIVIAGLLMIAGVFKVIELIGAL